MKFTITLRTFFLLVILMAGCGVENAKNNANEANEVRLQGPSMGTVYNIAFVADEQTINEQDFATKLHALFEKANSGMSTYQQDSEISRFNGLKSTTPIDVSDDFQRVVLEGIRLNDMTHGALDITLKPLSALWGFGPEGQPHTIPSDQALAEVRMKTGVDKLFFEGDKLGKKHPDLALDLNTIAKGYVVDLVAELIESYGVFDYMVEIGGEMRLKGINGKGRVWTVGVIKPIDGSRSAERAIYPGDNGLATSGDYYQYFEKEGVRYSHILDPTTGRPINHSLASVTVVHPSCMSADGWATAMMVLGDEKGMALAEELHLAVYMIVREDDRFVSKMSKAFVRYTEKPVTKH